MRGMDRFQLQRFGLLGLVLLAVLGLVYFWTRNQKAKHSLGVPEDDRGLR